MAGPARGRKWCAPLSRAVLPCLALIVLGETKAQAQSVTLDLFSPRQTNQVAPGNLAPRQVAGGPGNTALDPDGDPSKRRTDQPAASRIGKVPTYGLPAASGASDTGYDSLNRKRKQTKYYPGQARPKKPAGPGSPPPPNAAGQLRLSIPPS